MLIYSDKKECVKMFAILAVIYIVFISLGLPDSVFGVSWPVIHLDFGIAEGYASLYSIITGICSGGASFLAGVLLRKFGTPKVTFFSILLTAAGLVGISFAPNLWVMMLFAVVMAYGAGAIDTGLNNYVSLHYKAKHMSFLHCFWGIGVTVSPIIMSFFLNENSSWRTGYRVLAGIQLGIALTVLAFLKKWIGIDDTPSLSSEGEKSEKPDVFRTKGIFTSILSLGFYCSMEFTIGTWGATYLVNIYSLPADSAAKLVSVYFGGIMLGRLVSGFVSDRAGDDNMVRVGMGVATAGMILMALPVGKASCIGLLLIGFGFGPVFPSIIHSVPYRFGVKFSADLTGYHMGGAYAMGFACQLIFGCAAEATTFRILPYTLIAFALCVIIMNETTVKKLSRTGR